MNELLKLISLYSSIYNVDPKLVQAIAQVESGYHSDYIGANNERGVLQLLPSSFPNHSITYLENPRNNLRLGIAYLAQMKEECPYKARNEFIVCWNVGLGNIKKIHHPEKHPYYIKVMKVYKELKGE